MIQTVFNWLIFIHLVVRATDWRATIMDKNDAIVKVLAKMDVWVNAGKPTLFAVCTFIIKALMEIIFSVQFLFASSRHFSTQA